MSQRPPTLQEANESYYPKGIVSCPLSSQLADMQHESQSLKRARLPYQLRNVLTGGAIVAFIVSVYFYSISAVKQDDFVSALQVCR